MTPEQIQEIINYLLKTGELLATEGYRIAMRQVVAEGWTHLVIAVCCIAAIPLFRKLMLVGEKKILERRVSFSEDGDAEQCVGAILMFIAAVSTPFLLYGGIVRLYNPAWYAIAKLLGLF